MDEEQPQVSLPRFCDVATYPAGATYGPRPLRDWEFVWIMEGDVEYSVEDSHGKQHLPAPAGSVILCRPGVTDFFRWDARVRTRHAFFHFDVHSWPASWPSLQNWPWVRLPPEDDLLRPLFRHLIKHWGRDGVKTIDSMQCRLAVCHLLTHFVRGYDAPLEIRTVPWPDPVGRAWDFLQSRLEDAPSAALHLDQLASVACTTPEHLCRIFKNATGFSPMQAVRLARLDRTATLLARSNYSVQEIAELCGFASAFHFSRRFKEAYGLSPRELRRQVQAGAPPPAPRLRKSAGQQNNF